MTDQPSEPSFLDVQFGDNDFGWAMKQTLSRLWAWMNENNGHLVEVAPRSLSAMFVKLHNAGSLEPMIQRLFILEQLCYDVEFATRGLYGEPVEWDRMSRMESDVPKRFVSYEEYLAVSVEFHDSDGFTKEWKNGEHAWLNLLNGKVDTY